MPPALSAMGVSVNSNGQTGGGEHTYSSQRDTEQSHAAVSSAAHYKEGYDYADADEKHSEKVEYIPTAKPAIIVVAGPVSDC